MNLRIMFGFFLALAITCNLFAQNDLLTELTNVEAEAGPVTSTFKSTRVINSQSVETLYKGSLDVRISHRFGRINSGAYNLFGLDQSTVRLGLEYGLTDRITVGIGRSSYQKMYDSFFKMKVLQQTTGVSAFPFSVTWFSNVTSNTITRKADLYNMDIKYRYAFAHQIIIARKFSPSLSMQVAPIMIHRNLKEDGKPNDAFAVAGGGRVRVTKRLSINADYVYRLKKYQYEPYTNSFSLGVDIETGGHVFQLHVTNSQGIVEEVFAGRTEGSWSKGDIFYGFNISRQFNLRKEKGKS